MIVFYQSFYTSQLPSQFPLMAQREKYRDIHVEVQCLDYV